MKNQSKKEGLSAEKQDAPAKPADRLARLGPYLGVQRFVRLIQAARIVDQQEGLEIINNKFGVMWNPHGGESLMDYQNRVDGIIDLIMKKKRQKPPQKLIDNLQKLGDYTEILIEEIISNAKALRRLQIEDIERIEASLRRLRNAIKGSAQPSNGIQAGRG
jgi:hypothetical protein